MPKKSKKKTCRFCWNEFVPAQGNRQKFCSRRCFVESRAGQREERQEHKALNGIRTCEICLKEFCPFAGETRTRYFLYVLVLRDEPLLKIGYTTDVAHRASEMGGVECGEGRFDAQLSLSVSANCNYFITFLEYTLKRLFYAHKATPVKPINWYSQHEQAPHEVFRSSSLGDMIKAIRAMQDAFPEAGYQIIPGCPGRDEIRWLRREREHEPVADCTAIKTSYEYYRRVEGARKTQQIRQEALTTGDDTDRDCRLNTDTI